MSFLLYVIAAAITATTIPFAGHLILGWSARRSYIVSGLAITLIGLAGVILVGSSDWVGIFLLGIVLLILSVVVPFVGGMFLEFLNDPPGAPACGPAKGKPSSS